MKKTDVLILGGGLAGLCLARQLQLACSDLAIQIIEPNRYPVPVAAHKVGESTVEIGAHYLAETLQLKAYLEQHHLKKFGLRCFFGDSKDIAQADELGASESLQVSSYQLDRGLLENHLADTLQTSGVRLYTGASVSAIDFASTAPGQVSFKNESTEHRIRARWIIDASGRRGLLRRQLGLGNKNGLHGNAAWFRVNQRVCIDEWSNNPAWQDRIRRGERWLSTNHLMGQGYWVWLIPLSSAATSIGVVADADQHNISHFTSHPRLMQWLRQNQAQCADKLQGLEPMDYHWLRNYSYGCSEIFSRPRQAQRWALTGEAGLFLDPFYSPGMDFIGYANTYIADLILRDKNGEDTRSRQLLYQQIFMSVYQSSLQLYRQQYPGFGNFQLMSLKTIWDYAYYWGVLGTLFVNNTMTDTMLFESRGAALSQIRQTHDQLQQAFRQLASRQAVVKPSASFTDHASIPLLQKLNADLDERLDATEVVTQLDANLHRLHFLADEIREKLTGQTVADLEFAC